MATKEYKSNLIDYQMSGYFDLKNQLANYPVNTALQSDGWINNFFSINQPKFYRVR